MLALCLLAAEAGAHSRSASHSFWQIDDRGAEARAVIDELELTRLGLSPGQPDYRHKAAALLTDALLLVDADGACPVTTVLPAERLDGRLVLRWQLRCDSAPLALHSQLFADGGLVHTHFASLREGEGPTQTALLTPSQPSWHLSSAAGSHADAEAPGGFFGFLALGVAHILSGWDHLAFLLALVVLARSLRQLAWLVTGFTLGHSLTLVLAVLGLARPAATAVEAFIALSIILLAFENAARLPGAPTALRREPASAGTWPSLRWRSEELAPAALLALGTVLVLLGGAAGAFPALVVAGLLLAGLCYLLLAAADGRAGPPQLVLSTAFGLFHGFGFAGFLGEMALPESVLIPALLGFNLGVEVGQLLLLALAWPLLRALSRRGLPVAQAATAAAAGLGLYWYLLRLFG